MQVKVEQIQKEYDIWMAKGGSIAITFTVEHTNKLIHNITFYDMHGKEVKVTNFDISAILKIIEKGGYKLD